MTARLGQLLEFTGKKDQEQEPDFEPREPLPRRQSLGDLLRQTRERYRQDLETVSAELRIRLVYLRAIEDDRFDLLPGPTYASGFLRSYAEYLGLNSRDVVRRYRQELAQLNTPEEAEEPVEVEGRRFPRRTAVLAVTLAVVAVFVGWRYVGGSDAVLVDQIAGLPARIAALVTGAEQPAETDLAATEAAAPAEVIATPSTEPASSAAPDISAREPPADAGAASIAASDPAVGEATEESVAVLAPNGLPLPPLKPGLPIVSAAVSETLAEPERTAAPASGASPSEPSPPASEAVVESPAAPSPTPAPPAPPAPDLAAGAAAVPASPPVADPGAPFDSTTLPSGSSNLNALAAIPSVPSDVLTQTRSQTFGATNAGSRVLLYARLESWIQVTDAENVPLWTRVLRAGDSYLLPDQPGLTLATGNAGGLDIFVDGKKVPTLGPVGVERRGIVLNPERLKSGTAAP